MVRGLMNGEEIGGTDDATLIQHDVPSAHGIHFLAYLFSLFIRYFFTYEV